MHKMYIYRHKENVKNFTKVSGMRIKIKTKKMVVWMGKDECRDI